uniref:Zinc carboxypeptidase A 1 n=1 Tax=Caenorhabditis japonica TaxID=281687 RepID=A0A8R1DND6_CAEJA
MSGSERFKLIRINPETENSVKYLRSLYEDPSPYELDFWQPPTHIGAIVDLTVAPSDAPKFVRDLESMHINYIVAVNDLSKAIESERGTDKFYNPAAGFAYDKYNSLEEIHTEMKRLKKEYPSMITLIDIGQSHENRTLLVMKITGKRSPLGSKISMWIDGGIHAREWISPAVAMYMAHELLLGYENDAAVAKLMDHIDFYILPVLNPDGYEYSREKNRMWRKNRSPAKCHRQHFSTVCCSGVDLNRNFDWFWASTGSSSDPCHDTYHGTSAFSEPESQAVRDFLEQNTPEAFISLHSYSQMWLIPYGHRKQSYPQDYHTGLRPLALRATKALYELYGTKYQVGTGADLMYEASGGSHDWAKGQLKVPYAYLIELRPKNTIMGHGFLLPEREIVPTGLETFESIKVVADELVAQFVEPIVRAKLASTSKPSIPPYRRGYSIIDTTTMEPVKESTTEETVTTEEATTSSTSTSTSTSITTTTAPSTTTTSATTSTSTNPPTTTTLLSSTANDIQTQQTTSSAPIIIDEETNSPVKCVDYGDYCRLWGVLQLCYRDQVSKLCPKTCDSRCSFSV